MVTQGIYEHYKSTPEDKKLYQVILVSHFEETLEVMVHYVPLYYVDKAGVYDDGIMVWTRTLANFEESVEYNGKTMPRFRLVSKVSD